MATDLNYLPSIPDRLNLNGEQAAQYIEDAGKAAADIDDVNLFTKFIKKADEAAQAGI